MLRGIDRFLDCGDIRIEMKPSYSSIRRPSIDPELMIRILLAGYFDSAPLRPENRSLFRFGNGIPLPSIYY
jgi:hypothetical protein